MNNTFEDDFLQRSTGYEGRRDLRRNIAEVQPRNFSQLGTPMKHLGRRGDTQRVHVSDLNQIRASIKSIHHICYPRRVKGRDTLQSRAPIAYLIHRIEDRGVELREARQRRVAPEQLIAVPNLIQAAGAVHQSRFID